MKNYKENLLTVVKYLENISDTLPQEAMFIQVKTCRENIRKSLEIESINLLQAFNAYHNCIQANNLLWQEKHEQSIKDSLLKNLSHGSGINGKWNIEIGLKRIVCSNYFHAMNENGFYDRVLPFKLVINAVNRDMFGKIEFKIIGTFGKYSDIKDYLYETFSMDLENL